MELCVDVCRCFDLPGVEPIIRNETAAANTGSVEGDSYTGDDPEVFAKHFRRKLSLHNVGEFQMSWGAWHKRNNEPRGSARF